MAFLAVLCEILLFLLAIFLIVLILIQRGKGGGLAGALGGMGGQSAFGTKAGEKITWVTIYTAGAWIILCIITVQVLTRNANRFDFGAEPAASQAAGETGSSEKGKGEAEAPEPGDSKPAGEKSDGAK